MVDSISTLSIPGYSGYLAGVDGSVWEKDRYGNPFKQLKLVLSGNGYYRVWLRGDSRVQIHQRCLHILLCLAYTGEKPHWSYEVRHVDGVKANNSLGNLAWGSHEENMQDKLRHGTSIPWRTHLRQAKVAYAAYCLHAYKGVTNADLAKQFNVPYSIIRRMTNYNLWSRYIREYVRSLGVLTRLKIVTNSVGGAGIDDKRFKWTKHEEAALMQLLLTRQRQCLIIRAFKQEFNGKSTSAIKAKIRSVCGGLK